MLKWIKGVKTEASSPDPNKIIHVLWWLAALFPLLVVLREFIVGTWSWGLMDDHGMVALPGSIRDRFWGLTTGLWTTGRFPFTSMMHNAIFYKIFADNPVAFYVFRWLEVTFALGLWAFLAVRVTGQILAAPLFLIVTLSFTKFYDSFFFLSGQEILGVLFSGAASWLIFLSVEPEFKSEKSFHSGIFFGGILCLLLAIGAKEPFLVVSMALGMSLLVVSFGERGRFLRICGSGLVVFAVAYAMFLKFYLIRGYSADYGIGNWNKILGNLQIWTNRVLPEHIPWLVMMGLSLFVKRSSGRSRGLIWGQCLGVLLYVGYLVLILPWNAWGHYVTPLGVFFAFMSAVLVAPGIERIWPGIQLILIVVSLWFSIFWGGKAVQAHARYQYDTANLSQWMSQNVLFEYEIAQGAVVRGNAMEPCETIVQHIEYLYGQKYPRLVYSPVIREILQDPKTKYYLWKTDGGDQDLRRLGKMWSPVFVSESWYMFRRMYD